MCAEAYSDQNNIRHRQVHENVRWAIHEQVGNAALTALANYFPPRRPVPEKFGLQLLSEAVLPPKTQAALQRDAPKTAAVPPQTHKWILMRRLGGVGGSAKHLKGICSFAVLLLGLVTEIFQLSCARVQA